MTSHEKALYKTRAGMVWERGNGLHTFNNGIPSKVSDTTTMSLSLCTDSEDNNMVSEETMAVQV